MSGAKNLAKDVILVHVPLSTRHLIWEHSMAMSQWYPGNVFEALVSYTAVSCTAVRMTMRSTKRGGALEISGGPTNPRRF